MRIPGHPARRRKPWVSPPALPGSLAKTICVLALVSFGEGCSVFSAIGDAISTGYENTVTYFNAYYNARRVFLEAESEIRVSELSLRGKVIPAAQGQIPASAKQKLNVVIDKCSNILSFHPKSSLVDDALLLVGKSYFYQGEFLKSERKFTELMTEYPTSSLFQESQLWLARSQYKLRKMSEAAGTASALASTAERDNPGLAAQAYVIAASVSGDQNAVGPAAEAYRKAFDLSEDTEYKSSIDMSLGDLYFNNQDYEQCVPAYLKAADLSRDNYIRFYTRAQAALAKRKLRQYDSGIALVDETIGDFRMKEYLGQLRLERGYLYQESGRREQAQREFQYVDTTFAHTETASKAAFALGRLYEWEESNYVLAQKFYSEASSTIGSPAYIEAKRKSVALSRYFDTWKRMRAVDSLLSLRETEPVSVPRDSFGTSRRDSVTPLRAQAAPRGVNKDSLMAIRAALMQDFGDIFYSELDVPDSAVLWYSNALGAGADRERAPRILFMLAELARSGRVTGFANPDSVYACLIAAYPTSMFAFEARRFLGQHADSVAADSGEILYRKAESQIEGNKIDDALATLQMVPAKFPGSRYAAKSEYAIGWLYEYRFKKPDSAIAQYRRVVSRYPTTAFAGSLLGRVLETTPAAPDTSVKPAVRDTTRRSENVVAPPGESKLPQKELDDSEFARTRKAKVQRAEKEKSAKKDEN